MINHF